MRHQLICGAALAAAVALAADAAVIRDFGAASDAPGDDVWENVGSNGSGAQNFVFQGGPKSPILVSDPLVPGLTAAYTFEDGAGVGTAWSFFGQAGGGRANNPRNSFELFFRVDDLLGTHALLEIGGAAAGVSFVLDGDTLVWSSDSGGTADPTVSVSTTLGTGWHYAVGIFNRDTLTTSLYLDGQLIGDVALPGGATGWVGGNPAVIGGVGGTPNLATVVDVSGATDFDGAIATFRYHNEALTGAEILAEYNAVFVPAPSAAVVLASVGLAGVLRRRR